MVTELLKFLTGQHWTHTILDAQIITDYKLRNCKFNCALNISCQKTKYQPIDCILRSSKVCENLDVYPVSAIFSCGGFWTYVGAINGFRAAKKAVLYSSRQNFRPYCDIEGIAFVGLWFAMILSYKWLQCTKVYTFHRY